MREDSNQSLLKVSVATLIEEAKAMSAETFVERYGATALLSRPSDEQMKRAALQLTMASTAVSAQANEYLDDLLIMLRGFRSLAAFFLRPSSAGQTFTVGREASCDATIDDPSVSKLHASLTWTGQTWRIRDERSLNGTYVNADELVRHEGELTNGDAVALGDCQLVFIQTRTLRSQLLAMS